MDKTSSKFKKFNKLPRFLNYDLFFGKLTFDEFGLLLIYVMNGDWDSRHRKTFGTSRLSNAQVGKISELNRNKVANLKERLIKKGYIKKVGTKYGIDRISITDFDDAFQTRIDWQMRQIFNEVSKQSESVEPHILKQGLA